MEKQKIELKNLELIKKAQVGDLKSRNECICNCLGLVYYIVNKMIFTTAQNKDDLVDVGIIGLFKAINTFDAQNNIRLSTYAARCIENEILRYMRSERKYQETTSLDAQVFSGSDEIYSLYDVLPDKENFEEEIHKKILLKSVKDKLCKLPKNQAKIIKERYFSGNDKTQTQIAKERNCTRSFISDVERKGIQSLKEMLCPETEGELSLDNKN